MTVPSGPKDDPGGTGCPPPPAWARVSAHLVALSVLPSGVWRIGLAAGFPGGYTAPGYAALDLSWSGSLYLILLTVLTEGLALLTFGLVRPWGERVPRWVPVVGGRPVHPMAAVVPALTGAVILAVLWTPLLAWWSIPHPELTRTGSIVVGFLYLPLVAWAPLLAAVAVDYHRRHRPGAAERVRR